MSYVATMNTPGYLPWDDGEPEVFETTHEAWGYLADERRNQEDQLGDEDSYSETVNTLGDWAFYGHPVDVLYGPSPGYEANLKEDSNDQGIAYCVTETEEA